MLTRPILRAFFVAISISAVAAAATAQTRIRFARGTFSASVNSSIAGLGERSYVVGARSGQSFTGNISSRGGCVIFSQGSTSSAWTTESGDNYFNITNNCRGTASYTLTISIR